MPRVKKLKKPRKIRKPRRRRVVTKKDITTSGLEARFKEWIKEALNITVEDQFKLASKWYDFKIDGFKALIEVDGDYYHCNPSVYKDGPINGMQRRNVINDKKKSAIALSNGYRLIRVWEKDFNEDKEKVKNTILTILNEIKTQATAK